MTPTSTHSESPQVPPRLPDPDWLDALASESGQALLARISAQAAEPEAPFRLGAQLRREFPPDLVAAAFTLVDLRARAQSKFTRANSMYFTRQGLEQASSETVSKHRAQRFTTFDAVADLCCGIGGDLIQLGREHAVVAVDRDPLHLRMARLNAGVYDADARLTTMCEDVRRVSLEHVDAAFIDPARRADGVRARLSSGASDPPLDWCLELTNSARTRAVAIKAAPGLPRELVPAGWELEFVSEARALKECTLWSPALARSSRRATLLDSGAALTEDDGGGPVRVGPPGTYLLDPDPAVTRAGLVEELARSLGADVWKIDAEVAFLSSDRDVRTPFARTLRIDASLPWNLRQLRQVLRERRIGIVDVRKRGSAVDVDNLRTRLRLQGEASATVVLTRVKNKPWAFVCQTG